MTLTTHSITSRYWGVVHDCDGVRDRKLEWENEDRLERRWLRCPSCGGHVRLDYGEAVDGRDHDHVLLTSTVLEFGDRIDAIEDKLGIER